MADPSPLELRVAEETNTRSGVRGKWSIVAQCVTPQPVRNALSQATNDAERSLG